MNYFSIVIGQISMFVIYAVIGVIAVKTSVLNKDGLNVLSKFITKIALPILIFINTLNGATRQEFADSLLVIVIAFIFYLLLYVLSLTLTRTFHLQGNQRKLYQACTMFGNVGFMGIPIITSLFPEHGMLYIALFTIIDQLLLWTLGINLAAPVDAEKKQDIAGNLKKMVNPATVGIVLAVAGILLDLHLPDTLNTALSKIGAVTTPMAMIYLGGIFCYADIISQLRRVESYFTVLIKMCVFPIVFYYVLSMIPFIPKDIVVTMGILGAMPTMSSITMLAQIQKSDDRYSAGMIFITTVCSVITIPLVCFAIGSL